LKDEKYGRLCYNVTYKEKRQQKIIGGLAMKIREVLEKRMKEKQKKQTVKMVKKVAAGTVAGIAAGVVGGVLLAPKSGKETRDDIAKTAKDLSESAISMSVDMKETLENKVAETKNNAITAKEKISKYLSDKKAERNNSKDLEEVIIEECKEAESIVKTEE
jgi:gas vesicle protein